MVERFGIKTLNEGDLVHDGREMRQQLRQPDTRLAVLLEFVVCAEHSRVLADLRQADVLQNFFRHLLTVAFDELRLVIEQVEVRRPARLEEINNVFGLGFEMRAEGCGSSGAFVGRGEKLFVQQRSQGQRAHAGAALLEEFTAGEAREVFRENFWGGIHNEDGE